MITLTSVEKDTSAKVAERKITCIQGLEKDFPRTLEHATSAVQTLQSKWELDWVLNLYSKRKPKRVLEIGALAGGTLYYWITLASPGAHVVSIDVDHVNESTYESWFPENLDVSLTAIKGDSRSAQTIEDASKFAPYDWIYIDAGHYYEEAKADWINYKDFAKQGGVVIFHDITRREDVPWIEVDEVWQEIQAQGYITQELVYDFKKNAEWGTGVVYL